jgi:hypothetical protein
MEPGVVATILVAAGIYTMTSSITDSPKQGSITIQGATPDTKSITSIQSSSGSAGNYSVVLNLDSVSDITTDDMALISACSGGVNPENTVGCWAITNVDAVNSRITVTSNNRSGVPSGAVSGTAAILKTTLKFITVTGIDDAALNLIDIVLQGNNTGSTDGIRMSTNSLTGSLVGIRDFGQYGIRVLSKGSAKIDSCFISGNQWGLLAYTRGLIETAPLICSGNNSTGARATIGGKIIADNASTAVIGNGFNGIYAQYTGYMSFATSQILNNTNTDVKSEAYSFIFLGATTTYGTTSPAINTQGNVYAYIDT